ncbi:DCC1-like thiol-disulfide oxidoreductase family protein [Halalkalicoccus sp. NIPERK01]|uniref:DCC1-like thiol-disulfide oxidoreductase family protein n=1 Tax=Halalkalicoccus sp. NIPERK01 TaxID=3053469 RepID=UPI00256F2AD4|nr:DCC1-like thiol-disulfide oxidoreductase family protein [Halalkalicoccus sp. NIPERK01]MDL5362017.1 DCC1-like thiol-disulfide oxidoreductase family protein [Halalkalicoccus sp. NIPERK01]
MAEPDDREHHSVLIYDGECPLCSAAATAMRRLPGVGAVSWYDDPAQGFLAAQFEEVPFALVFVDSREERVYAGRAAANELCERAGVPVLVRDLVGENYEGIADAIETVVGQDRDPDPYHDSYPLAERASERFEALSRAAESTAVVPT